MKKVHLLPNIVTAFGLSCGLFVIFRLSMTPPGGADLKVLTMAAGILLLAVMADLLDGAIARAMHAESRFGGLFDSLADAITFGVSPSVVVLKTLSLSPGAPFSFLLTLAAMIYSVSGVLRLVRFSLGNSTPISTFVGLPIPAAAAALVSLNLFIVSLEIVPFETGCWILVVTMILLGYLMISRWKFPSLKTLHVKVGSFRVLVLSTVGAAVFLYGILYHFPVVFFFLCWSYILLSLVLAVVRLIAGKRASALEEFEPAEDEELE